MLYQELQKMPRKKRTKKNLSGIFLAAGILLITLSLIWNTYEKTTLSFTSSPEQSITSEIKSKKPVELIIPSLSIDLDIKESSISAGNWEINPEGASHLNISSNPGEKGNIIIYGHNKTNLLGKILNIAKGDQILLKDGQGKSHTYKVDKTLIVNPDDVWILNKSDGEILTLYTCTGFLDSKRFVVVAKLLV